MPDRPCHIVRANLADEPIYEMISYTQATKVGDDRKTRLIHIAEEESWIVITPNCEAAPRQLRKRDVSRQLCVDAICIDQANVSERNHQVSFMEKVHANAHCVMACIRTGDP